MYTIYSTFLRKFEFKDVVYYVPQHCLFWAQFFRLNTLQTKAVTQKENGLCVSDWTGLYRLTWRCVETSSSEASIPICQCIWRRMGQVSNLQQHLYETKNRNLRKIHYFFKYVFFELKRRLCFGLQIEDELQGKLY